MGKGGGEGEEEGEQHRCVRELIDWLPLVRPVTGDETHNAGMCPNCHSNQQPFGLQDDTHPGEPHQPGTLLCLLL